MDDKASVLTKKYKVTTDSLTQSSLSKYKSRFGNNKNIGQTKDMYLPSKYLIYHIFKRFYADTVKKVISLGDKLSLYTTFESRKINNSSIVSFFSRSQPYASNFLKTNDQISKNTKLA
ncbi:hypothetical protein EDEG_00004 [Edhazardia aedis USNM 41457]|uniref:Uncharacterized protein n=1 Tax=Edhazardia aedis (strain USNM 41457) TaxID=1003232 RepID=J9DS42_EDHAE|nr:hypothetical protein EDEG_00004 [Edhazardia aedis USNM 41457]|eukprot:EJW05395.1 hypothetical protein EDEG_00004 [Edhazardia aedis USNM 41457]